jgi:hypothetical protein
MNRQKQPAYWQLDMFIVVMIGLMVALMIAHLPPAWVTGGEIAWSVLTIAGMSLWVRANWAALQREERAQRDAEKRRRLGQPAIPARTLPLTPVQEHFMDVMAQIETDNSVVRSE